jgi:hypothetical protein
MMVADPAAPPLARGAKRHVNGERFYSGTLDCDDFLESQRERLGQVGAASKARLFSVDIAYDKTPVGGRNLFPVYLTSNQLPPAEKWKRVRLPPPPPPPLAPRVQPRHDLRGSSWRSSRCSR